MNLQGLTILVTRPKPAGTALCQRMNAYGATAIHYPTISIAPPVDTKAMQQAFSMLAKQDWLIFISPQAVYSSINEIRHQLPDSIKLAAIGKSTAEALHQAGYAEVLYPKEVWDSESFLNLPEWRELTNKNMMIICGADGRDVLEKNLVARGARVTSAITYRRILPTTNQPLSKEIVSKIDAILIASGDSIKNLKILLGSHEPNLCKIPLIVASDRIKKLACDLGFQTIWIAESASDEGGISVLAIKKEELCQIKVKK